jgi:glutaredoxin
VERARKLLSDQGVPHVEIDIEHDEAAAKLVEGWCLGFRSVPTIVVSDTTVAQEPHAGSPRDRVLTVQGHVITEPSQEELVKFLQMEGLMPG